MSAQDSLFGDDTGKDAVLSEDGTYRYCLRRWWDPAVEKVTFVMLNPSTADANLDDPTIRRCIGFAKLWRYGGLRVVNLYALRSTDPTGLWCHPDPVGPENDAMLARVLDLPGLVVAAWGANAKPDRVARFYEIAGNRPVHALKVTKDGHPGHPLYLRGDSEPFAIPRPVGGDPR